MSFNDLYAIRKRMFSHSARLMDPDQIAISLDQSCLLWIAGQVAFLQSPERNTTCAFQNALELAAGIQELPPLLSIHCQFWNEGLSQQRGHSRRNRLPFICPFG